MRPLEAGGLEQARHVYLHACGLPAAWAGRPQWRILETGFGPGLNFLAAWRAWKDDPQRPGLLHFVSIEAQPGSIDDLRRAAAPYPELHALAEALAAQWWDLRPGFHRLVFEGGRVLLTLCVGAVNDMLREQDFAADAVFAAGLGAAPAAGGQDDGKMMMKRLARCCRRGTVIAGDVSNAMAGELAQCGFAMEAAPGAWPSSHFIRGRFDPGWTPRSLRRESAITAGRCAVVGAGLAGASAAASLARRGWRVQVLDAAARPAAGASALPAGLLAPHVSHDDNLLSRLSRAGVRISLQQAAELLAEGDWQASGVMEKRPAGDRWHDKAAWITPAALVSAWLAQPGVEWRGNVGVIALEREAQDWVLRDDQAREAARCDLVVVAAAHASASLLGGAVQLSPVRGQVSWGYQDPAAALPPTPLNGNGHFIPAVALQGGTAWLTGSTYGRGDTGLDIREADHQANLQRLQSLDADLARQLSPQFKSGAVQAWTGVRCASADRRPLLGEIQPGLWVSTAMGSRGLTFAPLCAELLAARLHGEPLPLERKLAGALDAARRKAN